MNLLERAISSIEVDPMLFEPITHLPLSARAVHALERNGISEIGELLKLTETDLTRIPNIGRTTVDQIKSVVTSAGLQLGRSYDKTDIVKSTLKTVAEWLQDSDIEERCQAANAIREQLG